VPVHAEFATTEGSFTVRLFDQEVPDTVANFVGLAEGTKEWTHPGTKQKMTNTPFYDGIVFHRVISGFMIQGGDPLGQGIGGPGYNFKDEFHPTLRHSKAGILSMANAGPNTNGSQFFILHQNYDLPPNYVIFAHVTKGMDVVDAIATTATTLGDDGNMSKPTTPQVIRTVTIKP
jgi:peptidyl-prolyl cis-trans isomerase A (cyclophilin A)